MSRRDQNKKRHKPRKRRRHRSSSSSSSRSSSSDSRKCSRKSKRSKHSNKRRRRRSTSSSFSPNRSAKDYGRYKRSKQTTQVAEALAVLQPAETTYVTPIPQPENTTQHSAKDSDSELEKEIWSFDRAVNRVFRLLPRPSEEHTPAKPLSGIEHLLESQATPLLVLPQSKLVENTTNFLQNSIDSEKWVKIGFVPKTSLAPSKFYKCQSQYFPTDNIPPLEADASLLDLSSRGRCSLPVKSLERWEKRARKLVAINSHADLFSSAAYLCMQQ